MKFSITDIPEKTLQLLGISRRHLEGQPKGFLENLLSGKRSALVRFNAMADFLTGTAKTVDARMSLFTRTDKTIGVRIHPLQHTPGNLYALTEKEVADLQTGTVSAIRKNIQGKDGRLIDANITYDDLTRSFVATPNSPTVKREVGESRLKRDSETGKNQKGEQIDPIKNTLDSTRTAKREETTDKYTRALSISHSRTVDVDILIDMSLLASGLGGMILLEHLADMALHCRLVKKPLDLRDPAVRNMLASSADLKQPLKAEGALASVGRGLREKLQAQTEHPVAVSALVEEQGNPVRNRNKRSL